MEKKIITTLLLVLIMSTIFVFPAYASDVSVVIERTWSSAKTEIKNVVDKVVFPALSLILGVLFFVKLAGAYFDYRKHGQFEFVAPLILFVGLIFSIIAPQFIWQIIK